MKFNILFALLLICAFLILFNTAHKHTCVHNKISKKFKPVKAEALSDEEKGQRILQYTTTRQIKILIDESNLKVTAQERDLIVGKLVPVATEFLKNRLTVLTRGSLLKVPLKQCYEVKKFCFHLTNILFSHRLTQKRFITLFMHDRKKKKKKKYINFFFRPSFLLPIRPRALMVISSYMSQQQMNRTSPL